MYCPRCGAQHPDDACFCAKCGFKLNQKEPIHDFAQENAQAATPYNQNAVIGFALSLAGLFFFGLILGIFGIIFSRRGMQECDADPTSRGRSLAVAGLIVSIVDLAYSALAVLGVLYYVLFLGMLFF
ncbi:MAG: DUF4190 domain-containing protein [Clostridia bacterium]|nr:DUF4190 domain-containing protein [Clostridia bacterium]